MNDKMIRTIQNMKLRSVKVLKSDDRIDEKTMKDGLKAATFFKIISLRKLIKSFGW